MAAIHGGLLPSIFCLHCADDHSNLLASKAPTQQTSLPPNNLTAISTFKNTALCWSRTFEGEGGSPLRSDVVRSAIQQSLRSVFGAIGGALPFEVLEVRQNTAQVFLKADKR